LESSPLEEDGSAEMLFSGTVSGLSLRGRIRDRASYDEACRTGGYLDYGERDPRLETLGFLATRIR
jgi:hypothetical protein